MRQIHIREAKKDNRVAAINQLMFAASKKQLDSETLEAVWQAVLLGDEKATERLVESMEIYILAVAKLYWNRPFPSKMCCMPGDTLYLTY